jgi:hypothetical protein
VPQLLAVLAVLTRGGPGVSALRWLAVAFFALAGCGDAKQWEAFKLVHHCKIVGHTKGGTGFSSRGSIVFLPDYTSWLCDDGITYTREDS